MRSKKRATLSHTDKKTYKTTEIVPFQKIFLIFYDGKPMTVRLGHMANDIRKYMNKFHTNYAKAENAAFKLNLMFHTDKFTVHEVR